MITLSTAVMRGDLACSTAVMRGNLAWNESEPLLVRLVHSVGYCRWPAVTLFLWSALVGRIRMPLWSALGGHHSRPSLI